MQSALPDAHGVNLYRADPGYEGLLRLYLPADLYAHLAPHYERLGALAGGELDTLAATSDRNPPVLHVRDRSGADLQSIEKHPAYRGLENVAFAQYGLAAMSHRAGVLGWPAPLPPIVKYTLTYLFAQAEFGVCCPLSMTDALARTLARFGDPDLVKRFLPGLLSQDFDTLTQGAMFITEQGAGSDVGAAATRAVLVEPHGARGPGPAQAGPVDPSAGPPAPRWRLYGDKWFCSNADAGLALVLARPDGAGAGTRGLSLFLLPRLLDDGTPNAYRIVRLKDKLGTRGMASGEIHLDGALAYLVGDPERGFVQMADMINLSRLSNGMRSAGLMRRALSEALFVARHRSAFGKPLIELPLMRRQLLKLMLPAEAARSVMLYTATQLAAADAGDEQAQLRVRVLTPLLKFRACRDARKVTGDAMEVRGGGGYIEEWSDARLLRDAHLGSIWEGTSNIVALDVLRAVRGQPVLDALLADLLAGLPHDALGRAVHAALAAAAAALRAANDTQAREAASAFYYAVAAAVLTREGSRLAEREDDARRLMLAALVLEHKLQPRDPLRPRSDGCEMPAAPDLLAERPLGRLSVNRWLASRGLDDAGISYCGIDSGLT